MSKMIDAISGRVASLPKAKDFVKAVGADIGNAFTGKIYRSRVFANINYVFDAAKVAEIRRGIEKDFFNGPLDEQKTRTLNAEIEHYNNRVDILHSRYEKNKIVEGFKKDDVLCLEQVKVGSEKLINIDVETYREKESRERKKSGFDKV